MGRQTVAVGRGRVIVMGADRPMRTWYAQLYDDAADVPDEPSKGVGYHPAEQALGEGVEYGPYPVVSLDALVAYIEQEWGITIAPQTVDRIRRAEA